VVQVSTAFEVSIRRKLTWWTTEKEGEGQLVPWIHSLVSHVGGDILILFQLGDNISTAHNSLEQHLDVCIGAFRALVVWVEVFRFENGRPGYSIASKALLLQDLRIVQQNVDLASVAKIWPVAHAAEDIQGDAPSLFCSRERLSLELSVEDDCHFLVAEVFEEKARGDGEASGESRIGLLHHLFHLLLIAKQQHASVVSGNILHLGDDGVDDGSLVRIR
jgi:hypothetical protein